MNKVISCGGVVIHKNKVLLLFKNKNGKYVGWTMPKGTAEQGESLEETALREVQEESDVKPKIIKYIGNIHYSFQGNKSPIHKTVHWYLMTVDSFYCKPQASENFVDAGFYKPHEAFYLLRFYDEKQVMRKAFDEYNNIIKNPLQY